MFGDIKERSKRLIAEAEPKPINVGLLFTGLSLLVALISTKLFGGLTEAQLQQYIQHLAEGNIDYALEYLRRIMPTPSTATMIMLLQAVLSIVSVGFTIFLLNTVRGSGACFGNLLDGFGFFWKILIKDVLVSFLIGFGFCLLLIPGILFAYAYRLTTYIMIDHPDYSVIRCMRESRKLMRGHKAELFALDISFLGWYLLMGLPLLGYFVMLWCRPFTGLSYALFYERISGREQISVPELEDV